MRPGAALGALSALVLFATALPARPKSSTAAALATPAPKEWLRMYPLAPYSAHWHVRLGVKDPDRAVVKLTAALEKRGGELEIPLDNSISSKSRGYRQASYRISARSAPKISAILKHVGTIEESTQTPESYPGLFEEARAKLDKLRAESAANAAALSKMPSISALIEELTEHLTLVERVHEEGRDRMLLDVELQDPTLSAARP